MSWVLAGTTVGFAALSLYRRRQRDREGERFLEIAVESAPMAVVMLRSNGAVTYANAEARALFFEGKSADGQNFLSLLGNAPAPFREAMLGTEDVLFTVDEDTFSFAKRTLDWHGELTVLLVRPLTREIRKQEIAVWKKLLRVISHELNNSLAPISSMAHSARAIAKNPEKLHLLDGVFTTIEDRTKHLTEFLAGYASLARLPAPRRAHVVVADVVKRVAAAYPTVSIAASAEGTAFIDEGQVEQVLVNLLKNALEASDANVEVATTRVPEGVAISVRDRGPGMTEDVLKNALLPFYSTKERGTGLGLALCREIVDAHDGKLRLENRADGGGLEVTCTFPDAIRPATTQTKLTVTRV